MRWSQGENRASSRGGATDHEGRINLTRCCEHYSEVVVGLCYLRFPLADGLVDDSNAAREKAFGWIFFFSFGKERIAGFPRALIGGPLMTEVGASQRWDGRGLARGCECGRTSGWRGRDGAATSCVPVCFLFPTIAWRLLDGEMPFSRCGSFLPCQPNLGGTLVVSPLVGRIGRGQCNPAVW